MDVDDGFVGAIASRYRIERELGRGGMAVVYLAQDLKHRRPVALKVLRPEVATTLGAERFLREITIAARLVHPNILPLHDSGEAAGRLYYVMPYVDGATLRQRLDREKQLPLDDVVEITSQIAAALDYAHAQGVVHRDVKPDNVLLVGEQVLVADFGLARALTSATSSPLTRSGTVVGTPAYMSPEQCSPGEAVDTRSDVYALACMVFEMIAGVTPFRGANAQAMIAHQISADPPSVCAERPRCPTTLDEVLRRGLAKSAADRYQKAGELADGLASAIQDAVPTATPISGAPGAPRSRGRRWVAVGVLGIAIVAGGWLASQRALGAKPALDRSTYAVFPFRHVGVATNAWLDGDGCARLLHDAMARWDGIRLVDDMRVGDVWARRRPRTVDDAMRAAEVLHAGALAWGEVVPVGDSLEIRAVAYDVSRGEGAAREFRVRVARNATQMDSAFAALADSIVIGGTGVRGVNALGTHNLTALHQFLDGREALDRFDLRAAEERFAAASQTDEDYAQAHLWTARVRAWRESSDPSGWLADATRAVALSASLSARDAAHALALRDLAEGHAPQACRRYRALTIADSTDFAAWLGLGDCNARDDAVVRDARSSSGFAFRGSYYTAVNAYRRALALVPSFQQAERGLAFQRLAGRVLYTEESMLRRGMGVPPDTQRYVAFPSFQAETLAFIPVRPQQMGTLRPSPTEHQAVAWATATLRGLMGDWLRVFPGSADAQSALSSALEAASAVEGSTADLPRALQLARAAAAHTDSADLRVVRQVAVVRLLVKSDSLGAAQALSESTLTADPAPTPARAGYLANLAALTGRAMRAAALLRVAAADTNHIPFLRSDGRRLLLPNELMGDLLGLRVYAALDEPHDSVLGVAERVQRAIDASVPPPQRAAMRRSVLATPVILAREDLVSFQPTDVTGDYLLLMHTALSRGDTRAARDAAARFADLTGRYSAGTVGIDRLTAYSTMLLMMGDTNAARNQLDAALDALPRARHTLLEATPQAGMIGRALMLRAELALRAGDRPTTVRRLAQVAALWQGADPGLRDQLTALRRQSEGPR